MIYVCKAKSQFDGHIDTDKPVKYAFWEKQLWKSAMISPLYMKCRIEKQAGSTVLPK